MKSLTYPVFDDPREGRALKRATPFHKRSKGTITLTHNNLTTVSKLYPVFGLDPIEPS